MYAEMHRPEPALERCDLVGPSVKLPYREGASPEGGIESTLPVDQLRPEWLRRSRHAREAV